jgi:hypothetical protein
VYIAASAFAVLGNGVCHGLHVQPTRPDSVCVFVCVCVCVCLYAFCVYVVACLYACAVCAYA